MRIYFKLGNFPPIFGILSILWSSHGLKLLLSHELSMAYRIKFAIQALLVLFVEESAVMSNLVVPITIQVLFRIVKVQVSDSSFSKAEKFKAGLAPFLT